MKKARPEGILEGFSCVENLNVVFKRFLSLFELFKQRGNKMYKALYFVHCENCCLEYNSVDVKILKITHNPYGIKTAEFICTNCEEPTLSIVKEV